MKFKLMFLSLALFSFVFSSLETHAHVLTNSIDHIVYSNNSSAAFFAHKFGHLQVTPGLQAEAELIFDEERFVLAQFNLIDKPSELETVWIPEEYYTRKFVGGVTKVEAWVMFLTDRNGDIAKFKGHKLIRKPLDEHTHTH